MTHQIHPSVRVDPSARITCKDLVIGAGGVIGPGCVIEGRRVVIGRDLWMDVGARIGGGSCEDPDAHLTAGDFLHLGKHSEINIARGVTLGDEVGIGVGTGLYTHGAYLDELAGFPCRFEPIRIGSRVWLPHAWVNPGVRIGDNVVVAAGSVVNADLPSGCLAGGVPCRVLRADAYPRPLSEAEQHAALDCIVGECRALIPHAAVLRYGLCITVAKEGHTLTIFDTDARTITGQAGPLAETVRNQLRRHGIRFRYEASAGGYRPWPTASSS